MFGVSEKAGKTRIAVLLIILASPLFTSQNRKPETLPKHISLADVLSCEDDPILQTLFALGDKDKNKFVRSTPAYDAELAKSSGFWLQQSTTNEFDWFVILRNPDSSFCHSHVPVFAELYVEIAVDPSEETLDANEIFQHADQFIFKSGTYINSTEVYLNVNKADVFMQFVFRNGMLRLIRVDYMNSFSDAAKLLVKHWMDQNDR